MEELVKENKQVTKSETVVFNGIPFRRYPNSKSNGHRSYYRPSAKYIKQGVKNLHVEIWKSVNGEVPKGCEIHHKDWNPLNNSIENLECLTKEEHYAIHSKDRRVRSAIAWKKTEKFRLMPKLAAKWHGTKEGRAWHSEHAKNVLWQKDAQKFNCEICSNEFKSKKLHSVRFCSNKCRTKFRRESGIDDVEKSCAKCGNKFISNKYDKLEHCGRLCARRSRHWLRNSM